MAGARVHPIRGALVCLSLLVFLSVGHARAQSNPSAPATLRLAQVVVRLPHTYLFASAQDEDGNPFSGQWGKLSALIGPNHEKVDINQQPGGIGIVFLIDISKSLSPQQFAMIRESVHRWINLLGPNDRAAIMTLGSRVTTVVDFTADKSALISALANPALKPSDQQTLLYQGLVQAIDLSQRLDPNLPLRRAIVVLTDGIDDEQGGASLEQEVLDKLAVDRVPIYGLGAAKRFDAKVDSALKDFSALVRASGGDYRSIVDISRPTLDIGRLNDGYTGLRKIVDSTKPLSAECPQCAPDGSPIVIRLFMSYEDTRLTRLSSESVTVRSVDLEGKVVQPQPPATGILALQVSPPVAVLSLGGKPAGSAANFRQEVPAGPHDLEISAAGYQSRHETVTVPAGGEKSMEFKLVETPAATGILALRVSPPAAVLSLDGKPAGPAANFRQEVLAGTHDLGISAVGYQSRHETVTVPAGGEKSMEFKLVEIPPGENWLRLVYKFFRTLPLQWLIALALITGGFIAGIVWYLRPTPDGPRPTTVGKPITVGKPTTVISNGPSVSISSEVLIPLDTRQDKQRLRLYPIGHSDIAPFDLLFEKTLAVGRSPDSEICISNDEQVSASHCALSPKGKFILVEDAGSRNGTRVNGVPINGFLHAEPDSTLGVGRTELRMKLLPVGAR